MVGIESKSNKRPIYSLAAPEMLELPNVGTAKEFDLETCLSTEPDLVILPMKQKDTASAVSFVCKEVTQCKTKRKQILRWSLFWLESP